MEKLELLAPAQDYKTAISAINCGADAVYIGASNFGARINASNSLEDIKKVIDYAHLFNVKVYITINTILDDEELKECEKLIHKLYEIQADAIIFQDFGILELSLENKLPPIVLHASTQCDIRTLEKVKFFEEVGIKRVILARELSLNQIEKIRKNTNIQLEHFVHGALCVSYSGQCYLSHFIGKRSANKGQCAQACRKKYSLVDEKGKTILKNQYLLSLKDNNLSNHLDKLIKAGVMSFKIEGRLKDENYVKNTILYYHEKLKNYPRQSYGEIIKDFTPNPDKTFNRGFCDDYLFNKKDNIYNFNSPKSMGELIGTIISSNEKNFVIKTKSEINPQDGLCFISNNELIGCLVNKCEKTKDGVKIYPNKKINVIKGTKIYRNSDTEFNKTLENSKTTRKLNVSFVVYDNKIEVFEDLNNKISLNYEYEQKANNENLMRENFKKALTKTTDTPFLVQKIEFKVQEMPFLPVSKINELRREILEKLIQKILSKYKTKKQKPIDIAKFPYDEGDYKLNVHNLKAREFYEICGCKVIENSFESIENHKNKELMRTRHCLKKATSGCNSQEKLFLVDEKNLKYPLKFDCKNCEMVILAP